MCFCGWICCTGRRFPSGCSFFASRWHLPSVLCALAMANGMLFLVESLKSAAPILLELQFTMFNYYFLQGASRCVKVHFAHGVACHCGEPKMRHIHVCFVLLPGQMMRTHLRNLLTKRSVTTRSILLVTFAMLIGQTIHVWPNGARANISTNMRARTLLGASGSEKTVIGTAEIGSAATSTGRAMWVRCWADALTALTWHGPWRRWSEVAGRWRNKYVQGLVDAVDAWGKWFCFILGMQKYHRIKLYRTR